MKIEDALSQLSCIYETAIADWRIRKVLDLPRERYSISYDPSAATTKETTPEGTWTLTRGGLATLEGVIYPYVPDPFTALHETVHLYQLRNNPSIRDIKNGSDAVIATIHSEALATALEHIDQETLFYKITHTTSTRERQKELLNYLVKKDLLQELAEKSEKPIETLSDLEQLYFFNKKKQIAYRLGRIVGRHLFVDWRIEPKLKDITIGEENNRVKCSFSLEFRIIDPEFQKRLLKILFWNNCKSLTQSTLEIYSRAIKPTYSRVYEELLKKLP